MEILAQICDEVVFIKGEEGKLEGKLEIIRNMLKNNVNLEQISQLTNTPIDWIIKNIKKEI